MKSVQRLLTVQDYGPRALPLALHVVSREAETLFWNPTYADESTETLNLQMLKEVSAISCLVGVTCIQIRKNFCGRKQKNG